MFAPDFPSTACRPAQAKPVSVSLGPRPLLKQVPLCSPTAGATTLAVQQKMMQSNTIMMKLPRGGENAMNATRPDLDLRPVAVRPLKRVRPLNRRSPKRQLDCSTTPSISSSTLNNSNHPNSNYSNPNYRARKYGLYVV